MHGETLAVIAITIIAFGMISGRIEKTAITAPMVFTGLGILVSPAVLGLLDLDIRSGFYNILAELTLVLVLFTDAARIDLGQLRREHGLPLRMLSIGLPLTILLGAVVAGWIFDYLSFWDAAVVAAILAPTDAALGQSVVSHPRVPARIRQALNVESGLNDGIALPVVVIMVSCLGAAEHIQGADYWLRFTVLQVVLGPLVGIAVGYLGGRLVSIGERTGWMNQVFLELSVIGLSLASYSLAELVGGNGFMAAFVAGLTLGSSSRAMCTCLYQFAEAEGQLMMLLVFMIFGAVMVPSALQHLDGSVVLYAFLSLTVIRLLPVLLSLLGTGLRWDTQLFLGWFGPRGIASILFVLLVLENSGSSAAEEISNIVSFTVLLSIFAHGSSAFKASTWYGKRMESDRESIRHENMQVSEMPVRVPLR